MNDGMGALLIRRAGLVLWGAFTLALLFAVVLLARQIYQLGETPLALGQADEPMVAADSAPTDESSGEKEVSLYFADSEGQFLRAERRPLELTESTTENCRQAVMALIAGPQSDLTALLPTSTRLRGLFLLEGGEAVVDFSQELAAGHRWSASTESLLVQGLAHTLVQSDLRGKDGQAVSRVRLLLEGNSVHNFYTGHIDLNTAYGPDGTWVGPEGPVEAGHG